MLTAFKKLLCKHKQVEEQKSYGPVVVHRIDGTKEKFQAIRIYECCTDCGRRVFLRYEKQTEF